jgi:hypothetical protein
MAKSTSIDFSKRADECLLHSATAQNDVAREVWAKMEQYWRKRAAGSEAPLVPAQPVKQERERVRS